MNAKRISCVCAGFVLVLVLFYTFGAHQARTQENATIVDVAGPYSLDSMGRVYRSTGSANWQYLTQVPAPGSPVAIEIHGLQTGDNFYVAMPNGDTYGWIHDFPTGVEWWEYRGNIFGTVADASLPDPKSTKSWSGVKDSYRK